MTRFQEDLPRLANALGLQDPARGAPPPGMSAVLLPVFEVDGLTALLYTRRARTLSKHAGEVSFPGGRIDPEDESPRHAAIRETVEEVGIRPDNITLLGHLTDYMTYRGILVSAYVGHVRGPPPVEPASPDEVESIHVIPVRDLLRPDWYEGRRYDAAGRDGTVHYWQLDECTVWGITGELTARFLRQAYGWTPPKPPRPIHRMEEFLPERDGTDPLSRA